MRRILLGLAMSVSLAGAASAEPVLLHAAGSLRAALTEAADAFTAESGLKVTAVFGASGLLRERIEGGEKAEVFASADLGHPETLARGGRAGPVTPFAKNALCAFARRELGVTAANLLDRMLDPALKLGTSTPKADPSGDYAWQLFARAESMKPGARAALEAKALQLTGGPTSPKGPEGRNLYAHVIESGQADLFLAYCTNAPAIAREAPGIERIDPPPALAVGADYGLTVINGASPEAARLAMFVTGPKGQAILARHGFLPP